MDAGQAGADRVWDFSLLTDGTEFTYEYISPSASLAPSRFPSSNIVERVVQDGVTNEVYYSTATGLNMVGTYIPTLDEGVVSYNYSEDEREMVKFPLSYNTQYNETFAGVISSDEYMGMDINIKNGVSTIKADGYGSLKLPYATINNVLRVKMEASYSLYFMEFPYLTFHDICYYWYNATTRTFIAYYGIEYGDDEEQLVSSDFMYLSSESLSAGVNTVVSNIASMCPNPAGLQDIVTIQTGGESGQIDWVLLNMTGMVVRQGHVNGQDDIQISMDGLAKGAYIIKLAGENYQKIGKLIVR